MKLIQQARIITKGNETERMDVLFDETQIVKIAEHIDPALAQEVIPAENCVLLPGLIDVHAHPVSYTHLPAETDFRYSDFSECACLCHPVAG